MPGLSLSVKCDATRWGEEVAVIGSWNAWNKKLFTKLNTTKDKFPKWEAVVPVSEDLVDKPVEYKYVIVRDGNISRWEGDGGYQNRSVVISTENVPKGLDIFGSLPGNQRSNRGSHGSGVSKKWEQNGTTPRIDFSHANIENLDALEKAIVRKTDEQRSWRQRLAFIRSLFTDDAVAKDAEFDRHSINALATISIYLTFLSSGQVRCEEDGGHHRPNHHAGEARQIEAALATITQSVVDAEGATGQASTSSYVPYVIRKIFPQLPSYSSQFTASVPLTRIRDIAHRGDIPHDLKQEIKHTLQNKLHRCAGPEDLQTSARILERINQGGYSHDFTEQFRIFHAELCAFFNASSLEDRLRYLESNANTRPVASLASNLLGLKTSWQPALGQLEILTELRRSISQLPLMRPHGSDDPSELPSEDVQKTRLADIDLENYSFLLLAGVAKELEEQSSQGGFDWSKALTTLSLAMENMDLSRICPKEAAATRAELSILANRSSVETGNVRMLRTKAAIDRTLRFAEQFSSAVSDVYSRRVVSIGQALGVDNHSISVFAEAEIRSNITFQASRIADVCSHICRKVLSLPPWDPLFAGEAIGKLIFVEHLGELNPVGDVACIAVCRNAEGDEDIPAQIQGVVLGRPLPHLSHLGVRARQAEVVFVCAEDRAVFEEVWGKRDSDYVSMRVNAREGLASFSPVSATEVSDLSNKEGRLNSTNSDKKPASIHFDGSVTTPISIVKASQATTSSKCSFAGKLSVLAAKSGNIFEAANGVALPHGMFQAHRSKHAKQYDELIEEYGTAFSASSVKSELAAKRLYDFIASKFILEDRFCKKVQQHFQPGTKVMVRSSANAEDLEEMSGAGLYDSIANVLVDDADSLKKAVAEVWASLWTKRAASSRASYNVPHTDVSMAVLVQEMVQADLSFVGFSQEPVSKERDNLYIEVAVGMGETLASASSSGSPYRFKVDRSSLEIEVLAMSSYSDALVPSDEGKGGLHGEVIDYSQQAMTTDATFRQTLVERIAKTVLMLEQEFGGPQDIEGAVSVDVGKTSVYVVQARPQIL